MPFVDRFDAGRQLAARLRHLRGEHLVVLGLPPGGVPVAFRVAEDLGAPLDVVVVRGLAMPHRPEVCFGAIGENGARVMNDALAADLDREACVTVEWREHAELERRTRRYRGSRPRAPLAGTTAVVVADRITTGVTAETACHAVRARGADRVVLATPVCLADTAATLRRSADEVVCVHTPRDLDTISQWYLHFPPTGDDEVADLLARAWAAGKHDPSTTDQAGNNPPGGADRPPDDPPAGADRPPDDPPGGAGNRTSAQAGNGPPAVADTRADGTRHRSHHVRVRAGVLWAHGSLVVPHGAELVVAFAHGRGRSSPRNRYVAGVLHRAGLATLLFDLLTPPEVAEREPVFDIRLLTARLARATRWLHRETGLPVGYLGTSTGAAAALSAAARLGTDIEAVVCSGGRCDLAFSALAEVRAPTLLIVGGRDAALLGLNRHCASRMRCEHHLAVVPGASYTFEEPDALETVAVLARDWFTARLPGERHGRLARGPAA